MEYRQELGIDLHAPHDLKIDTGPRLLMLAVLAQARDDVLGSEYKPRILARAWLESDDYEPFSFVWYCTELSLDPDAVRQGIFSQQVNYEHN